MSISAAHPLADHIIRLLHRHECVIVPQIGAFITQHQPTQFTLDGQLTSPKLSVRFDAALQQSDNLLIIEIAHSEHLSYSVAIKKLETYTAQWQYLVAQQGFVELDSIGRLRIDADQKWAFIAAPNALQAEVFGMPALILKPLQGRHYDFSEPEIKLRRYDDDAPTLNDAPTRPFAPKHNFITKWSVAIASAAMLALLWSTYQTFLAPRLSAGHYNDISANEKVNTAPGTVRKNTATEQPKNQLVVNGKPVSDYTAIALPVSDTNQAVHAATAILSEESKKVSKKAADDAAYTVLQKNAAQLSATRPHFLKPPKYASTTPETLAEKKIKPIVAKPLPATVVAKKDSSKDTAPKVVSVEKVDTYIFSLGVFQNIQFADRLINIAQQRNDNLTTKANEKGLVVVNLIAEMPQSKLPAYLLQVQKVYGIKALVVRK